MCGCFYYVSLLYQVRNYFKTKDTSPPRAGGVWRGMRARFLSGFGERQPLLFFLLKLYNPYMENFNETKNYTEQEKWVIEYKERVEKERSNNIEKFKKEFLGFESFLENKDFSFLVENGVTIVPIKKDSEQFKKILDTEPHRNEYGFQYAYISNEGTGVKIITENKTIDVLPKIYNENDMGDGQPQIEESAGETVREALKRLESSEKVGIVIYPDNGYRNYSLELEYGFNHTENLKPFLEKLDPEFFKGGGEYVGGSYVSEDTSIFKNKNGDRRTIPLKDLGSFLKQGTMLYLID